MDDSVWVDEEHDNPSECDDEVLESRRKVQSFMKEVGQVTEEENDMASDFDFGVGIDVSSLTPFTENITNPIVRRPVVVTGPEASFQEYQVGGDISDGDNEYLGSSDPGSFESDSSCDNEDASNEIVFRRSKFPMYKSKRGIPHFECGMLFDSAKLFKEAVKKYVVLAKRQVKFLKNETERIRVICKGHRNCEWLLFASYSRDVDCLQVKTYYSEDICDEQETVKSCSSEYLAARYEELIATHPDVKTRHLKSIVKRDLELNVSLSHCRRAKKKVLDILEDQCKEEYKLLWRYGEEILRSNPGSTVKMEVERVNLMQPPNFQRYYMCLDACKRGFKAGCRKVLGIDGCFLKGICNGELLAAVGRDGNNQMFPVAWAIVELECTES